MTGTGKSSLVNALCLGLGGNSNVSRAAQLTASCQLATILQTLCKHFKHLVPNIWCRTRSRTKTLLLCVQLLGRADNVRDFVRKGSSTGMTEIHLSSGQTRPIIITRHMSASDNKSKWLLNGEWFVGGTSLAARTVRLFLRRW